MSVQVVSISPVKDDAKTNEYRKAFKWAVTEYQRNQQLRRQNEKFIGAQKIAKLAKEKFQGQGPSRKKIEHAASVGQYSPGKRGRPGHMPRAVGDYLHKVTTLLRCHSIPVYPSIIIGQAKLLITGTKWEDVFASEMCKETDSVISWDERKLKVWYQRHFLTRPGINTASQRNLDSQRLKWCRSENFEQAYRNWEDVHVEAGIAYLNEEYDPNDPNSERIKFVDSELFRSASFDEVSLEADTGDGRKNKSERTVVDRSDGREDDAECASSRGYARMSGVGCSYLDNQPGVAVMLVKGETADAKLLGEGFTMQVAGQKKKGWVIYTPGGGMTNEVINDVMEKAIMWRWNDVYSPWELKNERRMWVITTDGVGIHINPSFLQFLLDNNVRLVLRCPYSSSKTQPEDVTSFWYLKNNAQTGVYKAKQERLTQKLVTNPGASLDESDILACAEPAWKATFTPDRIAIGYAACGYKPNTRRPFWDLLRKEQQAEKALARATRVESKTKTSQLNFDASVAKIACMLGVDEKVKRKGLESNEQKRARLTSGDIALIPGGANGPNAMPFAQLKASVGEIKSMNKVPCTEALTSIGVAYSTDDNLPVLRAKLLLCSAMHYNFGRLPRVWVDGKSGEAEKLRNALGSEASNFMTQGLVNRLPEAKKAKARLVLTYWMDEAALSASLGPPSSSSEPRPSRPSAVSSLSKLFVPTSAQSIS